MPSRIGIDDSLLAFHATADDAAAATATAGRVYATADDVAGTGEAEAGVVAGMPKRVAGYSRC